MYFFHYCSISMVNTSYRAILNQELLSDILLMTADVGVVYVVKFHSVRAVLFDECSEGLHEIV